MDSAGSDANADAIAAALVTIDIQLSQGRCTFRYGSHNPDAPAYFWHQWLDPIFAVRQTFEPGVNSLDAAVIYPPLYQTHSTNLNEFGGSPQDCRRGR